MGAAAEGLAQTPGQAAAAKRPAVPASLPLFNQRQHAKSQAEEEAAAALELQAETKRREAAEQKVKEVEEVRAAAWRQTQAHQAEMAQRDALPGAACSSAPGGAAGAGIDLLRAPSSQAAATSRPRRPQPTTRMRT